MSAGKIKPARVCRCEKNKTTRVHGVREKKPMKVRGCKEKKKINSDDNNDGFVESVPNQ